MTPLQRQPSSEVEDCRCGHKPEFCHRPNAQRWCGEQAKDEFWEGFERGLIVARYAVEDGRPIPTIEDFQ